MSTSMHPAAVYLHTEKSGDVLIDVHVVVNAARTHADGIHDQALRMRLHAPPVDGKANQALLHWVADQLGIARSHVALVRGQTAKRKQLRVQAHAVSGADWAALERV